VAEPIAGGGSAAFPGTIKVSVLKAGTAGARLLIPFTSLDASVRGEAVFGGVPVPLDLATRILPERTGGAPVHEVSVLTPDPCGMAIVATAPDGASAGAVRRHLPRAPPAART
jgi:hypothetical protein